MHTCCKLQICYPTIFTAFGISILFIFIPFYFFFCFYCRSIWCLERERAFNVAWKARESKWMAAKSTWKMFLWKQFSVDSIICTSHCVASSIFQSIIYFSLCVLAFVFHSHRWTLESLWKKLAFNLTWQLLRLHFTILNKSTICWPTSGKFQLICKCDWGNQVFAGYLQVCLCETIIIWSWNTLSFQFRYTLQISFA